MVNACHFDLAHRMRY